MMQSGFWLGIELQDFLFKNLNVTTELGFLGLCLGVASFSFLFEALRAWRASLVYRTFSENQPNQLLLSPGSAVAVCSENWPVHLLQTFLHAIQVAMGYVIMLTVMTFNTYLALCVLFGAGLGHIFFSMRKRIPTPEEFSKSDADSSAIPTAEGSPARSESPPVLSQNQVRADIEI